MSKLRSAVGFWSGSAVQINPTESVIILEQCSIADARAALKNAYEAHLESAITDRIEHHVDRLNTDFCTAIQNNKNRFAPAFECANLPAFQGDEFRTHNRKVSWALIAQHLEQQFPNREDEQKRALVKQMAELARSGGYPVRLSLIGCNWLQLGSQGIHQLFEKARTLDELIVSLATLRNYSVQLPQRHNLDFLATYNTPVLEICKKYEIFPQRIDCPEDSARLETLARGASVALALLSAQLNVLLPPAWAGLATAAVVVFEDWPWARVGYKGGTLARLLLSSTIRCVEDLPEDIHQFASGLPNTNLYNKLLGGILDDFARTHPDAPPWPLAKLHQGKERAPARELAWTPTWIERQDFPAAWVRYAAVAWESSHAGDAQRKRAYRDFLPWVRSRGFDCPSQVKSTDLDDPHHPNRTDTWRAYLEAVQGHDRRNDVGQSWVATATAWTRTANALKVSPDPLLGTTLGNPFEPLENPFFAGKRGGRSKTTRRRLPTVLHEAMLDVLCDFDEQGVPTYNWVRNNLRWDLFKYRDSETGQEDEVWCPSRAACLALLLVLPLRKKQARWLCRGLLDEHVWDFETKTYVANAHPLANWRYDDGSTQAERYGRPTGVLQPVFDPLCENDELGIFVNTNKTQMWDPSRKTGYDIPWPFVDRSATVPSEIQDHIRSINYPYAIISAQLKWQNKYNPIPAPVGFLDLPEDAVSTNQKFAARLPMFTPLFADLASSDYRGQTAIFAPVREEKLHRLFNAIAVETERRLKAEGQKAVLTVGAAPKRKNAHKGRVCIFDIHSLRVAGISRLIEMGIPIQIVQEFIVGHVTLIATDHYQKTETRLAREQLFSKLSEAHILENWEQYRDDLSRRPELWTFNPRFAAHRPADLLNVFAGWKLVPGGICPLGGTGCETGQPMEEDDADGTDLARYRPVIGGCGNCRFFTTGPAFLIQQGQCMNELMLEMRLLGRDRRSLHESLTEVDWLDEPGMPPAHRQRVRLQRETIKEQMRAIDEKLAPMMVEWVNRVAMRRESQAAADAWGTFVHNSNTASTRPHHVLVTGVSPDELRFELDSRMQRGGDFSLVRNILQSATLRGGLSKASSLAKEKCREFMDRILRIEDSRYLLIDIPDEKTRSEAAYLMAAFAHDFLGDDLIQRSLDQHEALPMDAQLRDEFMKWVSGVIASAGNPTVNARPSAPGIRLTPPRLVI